jgi:hypothetical protein
VQTLLRPIAKKQSSSFRGPDCLQGPLPKGSMRQFIIAAHDGSGRSIIDYKQFVFSTITPDYLGQYYEIWDQIQGKQDDWCLNRAYFHLIEFNRNTRKPNELLALHCDPNEPDDAEHAIYKRVPHIHVVETRFPISRAHFSLDCEGHFLKNIKTATIDSLTNIMTWAIQMLKEEVFEAINKHNTKKNA